MKRFSRRPSPAMAVAFIALLAALSGTAVALPGKNTVDSGDIKKNAVKAADIARNAVTARKIRNGAVTRRKIRNSAVNSQKVQDDSLTGSDINESTLGQVPSANTANSAATANNLGGLAPGAYQKTADLLHATVDTSAAGATIVRGRGATSVARLAVGAYSVTFERDVSNCTWTASAGRSAAAGTNAFIATPRGRAAGTPTEVLVVVWDGSVAVPPQVDGASFFLSVFC